MWFTRQSKLLERKATGPLLWVISSRDVRWYHCETLPRSPDRGMSSNKENERGDLYF